MDPQEETTEAGEQEGELAMENVTDPLDTDVLCGRGGAALRHPGNVTYRTLVTLNKGLYITCVKSEKLKISKSIVAAIREQKGRFLEKNKEGSWNDIGDKKAIEKTSQALREGQPKLKEKIAELGGNAATALMQSQQYSAPPQPLYSAQASARHSYSSSDGKLAEVAALAFAAKEYSAYEHYAIDQATAAAFRNHSVLSNSMNQDRLRHLSVDLMPPPPAQPRMGDLVSQMAMSNIEEERTNRMRPSMLKRGSIIAHELGIDPQSTRSLMSDFSNYGMAEDVLSMDLGSRRSVLGLDVPNQNSAAAAESHQEKVDSSQATTDRRSFFAKMKFSRPVSDRINASGRMSNNSGRNIGSNRSLGDGMPDIHFVGSNMSLYSNVSSIGDPGEGRSEALESRMSLMSGLSRISDTEDGNSIFSDLSKKIGNVSTRSMAMSEISNMDDADSVDSGKQSSPPQPMTSTSIEFE